MTHINCTHYSKTLEFTITLHKSYEETLIDRVGVINVLVLAANLKMLCEFLENGYLKPLKQ
jgi:hypothetical protein